MNQVDYKELTLRNGYFISPRLQRKISKTTLVFIGCGLSSSVITSCARLGFLSFVLIDGDSVELSNLNRQDFFITDIGTNKAIAISQTIKKINPSIISDVVNKRIKVEDVEGVVKKGDIIINCADFDEVTYEVDKICRKSKKISISPLNIGFGTVTTIFTPESKSLEEMTAGVAKSDKEYLLNFGKSINYKLPKYISKNLARILFFIARKKFFPQNIIAAQFSSAAILHSIVRYLDKGLVKSAPDVIGIDPERIYE